MSDLEFLRLAVEQSRLSFEQGNFPAGGVVVQNGEVIAKAVSSQDGFSHAENQAITTAYQAKGLLMNASLYASMQCCLMCTSTAYWGGIRRIVYAIPKSKVSGDYYETHASTDSLLNGFNKKIELIHMPELEAEALVIVRAWEKANSINPV